MRPGGVVDGLVAAIVRQIPLQTAWTRERADDVWGLWPEQVRRQVRWRQARKGRGRNHPSRHMHKIPLCAFRRNSLYSYTGYC
ncbi:hypothetical protein F0726_02602 [Acidithiobacillus caldus]|nr:hypothetical protein F0726_02602 [Acidithiobacillus caldus]